MEWLADPQAWIALLSLTLLEIVLGVDNIVFISVLSQRLPEEQQAKARSMGLGLALGGRVLLLMSISWIIHLEVALFTAFGHDVSGRDLILLLGGLFLLYKATTEIHESLEGSGHAHKTSTKTVTFRSVLTQILILDIVFSLDSVITAVGMADDLAVMITAVVIAVGFMMWAAKSVSEFIERHPTVKMLALSFLLLVGISLVAESFEVHMPRGYIYFAMGFSILVELLNMKMRKSTVRPVDLREHIPGQRD
ncbi:MAG: putative tellurium resistance membrane protein TerC [Gammaproteobacteria bacterium]